MNYAVKIHLFPKNGGVGTAIQAQVPSKTDDTIWDGEYTGYKEGVEDGVNRILALYRFKSKSVRDSHLASLLTTEGLFGLCNPGSYIETHDCYNDELKPCTNKVRYE